MGRWVPDLRGGFIEVGSNRLDGCVGVVVVGLDAVTDASLETCRSVLTEVSCVQRIVRA